MGPLNEPVELESVAAGMSMSNQRTAVSPDITLSLPAMKNFQPADMAFMRDAIFPRAAPPGKTHLQRPNRRRVAEGHPEPSRQENVRARLEAVPQPESFREPVRAQGIHADGPGVLDGRGRHHLTSWVSQTSPLQPCLPASEASASGKTWSKQKFYAYGFPFTVLQVFVLIKGRAKLLTGF